MPDGSCGTVQHLLPLPLRVGALEIARSHALLPAAGITELWLGLCKRGVRRTPLRGSWRAAHTTSVHTAACKQLSGLPPGKESAQRLEPWVGPGTGAGSSEHLLPTSPLAEQL